MWSGSRSNASGASRFAASYLPTGTTFSVTAMTRSASASLQRSEFDDFLFAPIGDERNGMLLSVISALARLDLDPRLEAANLARMPKESATERMTSLISALPDRTSAHRDPGAIAARLVALLPRPAASSAPQREPLLARSAATKTRVIIFVALMTFLLTTQFLTRSRQPPAQGDRAGAPASSMVSPPGSTP
jgi:hypothetical protein